MAPQSPHNGGSNSLLIGECMKSVLQKYDSIRGKYPANCGVDFWDLVVISSGDEPQKAWYEQQLAFKLELGHLPRGVDYLCFSDPDGQRIGSGGATLNVLHHLKLRYKEKLDEMRILIVHAGGYSKRLPSHSCSGKIFSPIPIMPFSGGAYQMLDLKLAIYLTFLDAVKPGGVFIASSDTIEAYNLHDFPAELDEAEGVTALAHPSSIFIGTTHGVYVMDQPNDIDTRERLADVGPCREVLQKPSEQLMRERGALVFGNKVYSDSTFWFDRETRDKFIQLYEEFFPMKSEVCIYGDFLTLLGSGKNKDFLNKLDADDQEKEQVKYRQTLRQKVGNTPLFILRLNMSRFYHLGTLQEYIAELTSNKELQTELNLQRMVASKITGEGSAQIDGYLISSVIPAGSTIAVDSIVEYANIQTQVTVGPRTILSNVEISQPVDIPRGFLYHTIPVRYGEEQSFVTVAFMIEDDLKHSLPRDKLQNLQWAGRDISCLFNVSDVFHFDSVFPNKSESNKTSLWEAKLFASADSMAESFRLTVEVVTCLVNNQKLSRRLEKSELFSMDDLVVNKDCNSILEFRKLLHTQCQSPVPCKNG